MKSGRFPFSLVPWAGAGAEDSSTPPANNRAATASRGTLRANGLTDMVLSSVRALDRGVTRLPWPAVVAHQPASSRTCRLGAGGQRSFFGGPPNPNPNGLGSKPLALPANWAATDSVRFSMNLRGGIDWPNCP